MVGRKGCDAGEEHLELGGIGGPSEDSGAPQHPHGASNRRRGGSAEEVPVPRGELPQGTATSAGWPTPEAVRRAEAAIQQPAGPTVRAAIAGSGAAGRAERPRRPVTDGPPLAGAGPSTSCPPITGRTACSAGAMALWNWRSPT